MMRAIVSVLLVGLAGFVAGCGKNDTTKSGDKGTDQSVAAPGGTPAAPQTTDDLKAAEGKWQIVSFQNPDPKEFLPDILQEAKAATLRVDGNLLKVSPPEGKPVVFVIRLNQSKKPKEIDLIPADDAGKPRIVKYSITGGPEREREAPPSKGI